MRRGAESAHSRRKVRARPWRRKRGLARCQHSHRAVAKIASKPGGVHIACLYFSRAPRFLLKQTGSFPGWFSRLNSHHSLRLPAHNSKFATNNVALHEAGRRITQF
jgi:hypothetical protein